MMKMLDKCLQGFLRMTIVSIINSNVHIEIMRIDTQFSQFIIGD